MAQFEKAIVRIPGDTYDQGLTPWHFGKPDIELARQQHHQYTEALKKCGVEIITLPEDNEFPDSCFVEDPAIVTERVAILTNFGAPSRSGEAKRMLPHLEKIYGKHIERIAAPGTVEGGDICQADEHFFIGLSKRTNEEGAYQLAKILEKYGYTSNIISIRAMAPILHLKTGLSYLGNRTFIAHENIARDIALEDYQILTVRPDEEYASNCIRVNDYVIIPAGFGNAIEQVNQAGFKTIEVEMSEFMKQDGGLSCLSLRIPVLRLG